MYLPKCWCLYCLSCNLLCICRADSTGACQHCWLQIACCGQGMPCLPWRACMHTEHSSACGAVPRVQDPQCPTCWCSRRPVCCWLLWQYCHWAMWQAATQAALQPWLTCCALLSSRSSWTSVSGGLALHMSYLSAMIAIIADSKASLSNLMNLGVRSTYMQLYKCRYLLCAAIVSGCTPM